MLLSSVFYVVVPEIPLSVPEYVSGLHESLSPTKIVPSCYTTKCGLAPGAAFHDVDSQ